MDERLLALSVDSFRISPFDFCAWFQRRHRFVHYMKPAPICLVLLWSLTSATNQSLGKRGRRNSITATVSSEDPDDHPPNRPFVQTDARAELPMASPLFILLTTLIANPEATLADVWNRMPPTTSQAAVRNLYNHVVAATQVPGHLFSLISESTEPTSTNQQVLQLAETMLAHHTIAATSLERAVVLVTFWKRYCIDPLKSWWLSGQVTGSGSNLVPCRPVGTDWVMNTMQKSRLFTVLLREAQGI
jgi:hypothetical protein